MACENNENKKDGTTKEVFKWSYDDTIVLCDVILQFILRNGRGQSFKWREIEREVAQKIGRPCTTNSCKHKYDAMRKDWRAWKQLRNSETGLGWDPISGKIEASTEWWQNKIKENPFLRKFREKGVSSLLEDKWEQLYGDSYATGKHVYVPTMEPPIEPPIVNVDDHHEEENFEGNPYVQTMLGNEENFYEEFVASVRDGTDQNTKGNNGGNFQVNNQGASVQVPNQEGTVRNQASKEVQKSMLQIKPVQLKRNRRQSTGAAMLDTQIKDLVGSCKIMVQGGPSSTSKQQASKDSITSAMQIVNRILEKGSDFWCYATEVMEDAVKREIFLNMDDDDSRVKWLNYLHRKKDM